MKKIGLEKKLLNPKVEKRLRHLCMLLVVTVLMIPLQGFSQKKITLNVGSTTLKTALANLKSQSGVNFVYNTKEVNDAVNVNVRLVEKTLDEALTEVLKATPYTYERVKDYILITVKKQDPKQVVMKSITGVVKDEENLPMTGVAVMLDGTSLGRATDIDGKYQFNNNIPEGGVLVFSFLGYETQRVVVGSPSVIDVKMKKKEMEIGEIVVTGVFTRRAESFTGSATSFKGEELVRAGNQNLLASLKNLDPSFQIVESLDFGSDPNRIPEIQMRGQNSFPNLKGDYEGNPNQPLFILDGFETTIEKVYDLNLNRIESITLLKDAAAKAIYGSKAANGVVVIETKRPISGNLRISYSGDLNVVAPDLTGYNLMNAAEKLDFEKERGMYYKYVIGAETAQKIDLIYKQNFDNVVKGVDTYWLSKPLKTEIGTRHSFNIEGGDAVMRYMAGISYNNISGVMKGSGRNTASMNTTLSYTYKNLIFRNSLEYTRNWSENSPYGSFSQYVNLNQYYQPFDENGNVIKIMGINALGNVYNPLYNATLNTKSVSGYSEFTDNFNIDWIINSSLRARGRISFTRNENSSDLFYPSSHTMFNDYDANGIGNRKGRYTKDNGFSQYVTADAGFNYNKIIGSHLIFANLTWNMSSKRLASTYFTAEGFGNDNMDNISFATQYELYGKPSGFENKVREIGVIGALSYSYNDRYLFDASIRTSGSSMYGSNNRWGTFWSLGTGWNIHKEKFVKDIDWLTQLKIRSSIGYTGSQNFNPFQSRARYDYGDIIYNGRLGAELLGLPNSSLKWQRTMDFNAGLDIGIKRIISGRFDYYISTTNDLLSDMTIVPSMGFSTYKENLGIIQNKGYELSIAFTPWRNDNKRSWITMNFSAIHNENKIKEIYDIFTSWNEDQDEIKNYINNQQNADLENLKRAYTRPSTYFFEGQSMTAIWGVRSLGIDPVTGNEMYLDKNGKSTWVWSTADQVVIGDYNPKLRGNIGLSAGYKGFNLSLVCTYKFGGNLYNTTLIDRVENVTGYDNLDKRILDSWRKVGDISQYRALNITAGTSPVYTKPTSRFIQNDNELYISTLNLGYDFYNKSWMKKLSLDRLKLSFYMNELLRLSNVVVERGTSYPFARTFSFSLQATF